jgi:hypothetical protein
MNFSCRNWEGYYTYSLKVGGELCLLIGVKSPPIIEE